MIYSSNKLTFVTSEPQHHVEYLTKLIKLHYTGSNNTSVKLTYKIPEWAEDRPDLKKFYYQDLIPHFDFDKTDILNTQSKEFLLASLGTLQQDPYLHAKNIINFFQNQPSHIVDQSATLFALHFRGPPMLSLVSQSESRYRNSVVILTPYGNLDKECLKYMILRRYIAGKMPWDPKKILETFKKNHLSTVCRISDQNIPLIYDIVHNTRHTSKFLNDITSRNLDFDSDFNLLHQYYNKTISWCLNYIPEYVKETEEVIQNVSF